MTSVCPMQILQKTPKTYHQDFGNVRYVSKRPNHSTTFQLLIYFYLYTYISDLFFYMLWFFPFILQWEGMAKESREKSGRIEQKYSGSIEFEESKEAGLFEKCQGIFNNFSGFTQIEFNHRQAFWRNIFYAYLSLVQFKYRSNYFFIIRRNGYDYHNVTYMLSYMRDTNDGIRFEKISGSHIHTCIHSYIHTEMILD